MNPSNPPMICRSADDPNAPCPYCAFCSSAIRQIIQDRAGARGMDCDFFAAFKQREAYDVPQEESA